MAAAHDVTPLTVKEIFLEACDLPAEQRGAFLDARCGKDLELRPAVQALLDAHDRAGGFLAGPTLGHSTIPFDTMRAVQQIGPYGVRGLELTRFVSQTPSTSWLAIHVLRTNGKILIFFVTRPKSATTP